MKPSKPILLLALLGWAVSSQLTTAATRTWTGAGANGFWTNAANWNGGVSVPVNGDGLIFPAGAARLANTNAVGGPSNLLFLTLTGSNYTLVSPISLALTNGLTNAPAINLTNTVRANLELRANQTWALADKTVLTLASNVALGTFRLTLADGGSVDVSGNITGTGAAQLFKNNVGRLTLNGPANAIPDCQVQDGTLVVEGVLTGTLTVANDATLSGTGTVPPFTSAGSVRPAGTGVGVLTVSSGTAVFSAGSSLQVNLNGGAPGTEYDQLRVSSPPNLAGASLNVVPGFTATNGQVFVIITNTGAAAFTTTFTNLPEGGTVSAGGQFFEISYTGGNGNDVTLTKLPAPTGVTRVWSGAGADNFWGTPANWLGGVAPNPADDLVFPAGAARLVNSNNYGAGTVFNSITFSNQSYVLRGNGLRLYNGVHSAINLLSSTIGLPMTLLQPQTFTNSGGGGLVFTNSIFTAGQNLTLQVNNGSFTFLGGGLVTNGGTLVLSGTGTVTIANSQPRLAIQLAGGNLRGPGTVGTLTAQPAGGSVMPDNTFPGLLISSNLALNANTTLQLKLNGPDPVTQYDRLGVNGTVNLGNAALAVTLNFAPTVGATFLVLTNDGADAIIGTFAGLPEGATTNISLATMQITYVGGDGNDVALTVTAVQPPGTWTGLAVGNGWSQNANWQGGIQPGPTNDLVFPDGAAQKTNQFDYNADKTYRALTFTGSGYDISAGLNSSDNVLVITNQLLAFNATGTNRLGTRLGFSSSTLVSNVAGSTLRLTGLISNNSSVVLPVISPAGTIQLGTIGDTSGTLIKRGPGRLELDTTRSSGTNRVEAGTLAAASQFALGYRLLAGNPLYASVVVSNDATLEITDDGTFQSPVQLAGRLRAAASNLTWSAAISLIGTGAVLEVTSNRQLNISGALTGTNGLTIDGAGIVRFLGAKTYTGPTTVLGGQLFSAGLSTNASVSIFSGGTFSGTGPVGPLSCFNGAIAPGGITNPGALYCDQGVNLNAFSQLRIRLFDASGTNHDQLQVVGPVVLNNAQLVVTQANFVAPVGSSYLIITNDGSDAVVGTFAGLPNNGLFTNGPAVYRVRYTADTGNDVALTLESYLATGNTRTWTGAGTNGLWSNPQNWAGNIAPVSGDALLFPSGAARLVNTNDLPTNTVLHSVTFGAGSSGYRLHGNPAALIAHAESLAASGTNALALPLILTTNQPVRAAAGGTLAFEGAVDTNFRTLQTADAGHLLFLGPIVGGGHVDTLGSGLVEFRGTNTYAGSTRVHTGTLICRNSTPGANSGSALIVTNTGTLQLLGSGDLNKGFVLGGAVIVSNTGAITWNGSLQFVSNQVTTLTVTTNTTLRLVLALNQSQNGHVVKTGPGTLFLDDLLIPGCCYFPALVFGGITVNQGRVILESADGVSPTGYTNLVVTGGAELFAVRDIQGVQVAAGSFRASLTPTNSGRALLYGNLQLSSGARLDVRLNGVTPGSDHDQIGVRGQVQLNGATLNLEGGPVVPVLGSQFVIITNDSADAVIGTFAGLPQGAVAQAGSMFVQIDYAGGDGNDVVLTRVNPPLQISGISPQPGGAMQITGTGEPGLPHVLEGTTNLTPTIIWTPVRTNTADGLGNLNFLDPGATNFPQRFYRVKGP
ncbi:MAG: beta strand repeat-containing protein [Limisphaerales bacterium]